MTLARNFMSVYYNRTGSIYKFIEGVAGEYYDNSWKKDT
jgi:hypothetical protein